MNKKDNYRLGKNDVDRYTSFDELRKAFGLKTLSKRTNDEKKLISQREKFLGTCKCCGGQLTYVNGTNVLTCKNAECRGYKHVSKNEDGTERVWYTPVLRLLDAKGVDIAENLFS